MTISKKQKKTLVIGISIFILLIAFIFFSQLGSKTLSIGGFSTLSLGQQTFTSNDPTIGGQAWLLTVSQNGAGQSAYGTFTAEDNNGDTSNQFKITTSLDENYATYLINNQNVYINHVSYTTTTYNPLGSLGGCNPDVWTNVYKPTWSITAYCYKFTNDGVYGTVGSANVNFKSTILVEGKGGSDSCVISNNAQTSCTSNSGKFYVSWAGNLVSGQALPQPTDQDIIAVYNTKKGGWITSKGQYLNSWNTAKNSLISCINSIKSTSCFDNINNLENTLISGSPFTTSGGISAIGQGTQTNGQLVMNLPTQVQFPVLTMKIKASFIGINIPVGKPKIVSVSSSKFQTGSSGIIITQVSNEGTGTGNFDVFATCTNGFSQVGTSLRISGLEVGSSQTVYIPITSNVASGDIQGSCTVTAKDVNNPNNLDSKSVSVSSSAIAICTANELRISGNNIQTCQSNAWVTTQACNSTEIAQYVGDTPKCVGKGSTIKSDWFTNILTSIGNFFSGIGDAFTLIKYLVILVIFIFSMLFGKDLLSSFDALEDKSWLAWILAIVIALVISLIALKLFWIGIILAVIVIGVRIGIKIWGRS
jgi:hypothetical protein